MYSSERCPVVNRSMLLASELVSKLSKRRRNRQQQEGEWDRHLHHSFGSSSPAGKSECFQ